MVIIKINSKIIPTTAIKYEYNAILIRFSILLQLLSIRCFENTIYNIVANRKNAYLIKIVNIKIISPATENLNMNIFKKTPNRYPL